MTLRTLREIVYCSLENERDDEKNKGDLLFNVGK